ncbi:MAG: hypothetical protein JNL11_08230 [Bdellovibrionaceae bacterium]|nr:hypothetical protein [Pseudobdellovibrionaceae bacterium]
MLGKYFLKVILLSFSFVSLDMVMIFEIKENTRLNLETVSLGLNDSK